MNPQGWKPPEGLSTILIGENLYIIKAPTEITRNNEESGTDHRKITAQKIASGNLGTTDNW